MNQVGRVRIELLGGEGREASGDIHPLFALPLSPQEQPLPRSELTASTPCPAPGSSSLKEAAGQKDRACWLREDLQAE
jgi:hypothetical protein